MKHLGLLKLLKKTVEEIQSKLFSKKVSSKNIFIFE